MRSEVNLCDWCSQPIIKGQEFAEVNIPNGSDSKVSIKLLHRHCFNEFMQTAVSAGEADNILIKVEDEN